MCELILVLVFFAYIGSQFPKLYPASNETHSLIFFAAMASFVIAGIWFGFRQGSIGVGFLTWFLLTGFFFKLRTYAVEMVYRIWKPCPLSRQNCGLRLCKAVFDFQLRKS